MKICVAQAKPVKGDIAANIMHHKKFINAVVISGADLVVFPELSITGYEPELAATLATDQEDNRFDTFQQLSDANNISIGIGAPVKNGNGICIGMIIFQPGESRQTYLKKYLHSSEEPFFTSGDNPVALQGFDANIAIAICYEISVAAHAKAAHEKCANIYIASLVESFADIEKAHRNLKAIATKYAMTVLMSNCVGRTGNYDCAGQSAVWNNQGILLAQLNSSDEGFLLFDSVTEQIEIKMFEDNPLPANKI